MLVFHWMVWNVELERIKKYSELRSRSDFLQLINTDQENDVYHGDMAIGESVPCVASGNLPRPPSTVLPWGELKGPVLATACYVHARLSKYSKAESSGAKCNLVCTLRVAPTIDSLLFKYVTSRRLVLLLPLHSRK